MSVTYVLSERGNPQNPSAPKKFYAQAKARKVVTFRELALEIAEGSTTVSDTDVMAVLNDLIKSLRRHLREGEIVRFNNFGSFRITLGSAGADTEEQFHVSLIRKPKLGFTPGIDLKEMLATLKYEKA